MRTPSRATAVAPGKVNLALKVGPVRADGFHPLETVFQAVDLYDRATVDPAPSMAIEITGRETKGVPADDTNLAWRAAVQLAKAAGVEAKVKITLEKHIPVAGGMAGGSADAAATLVACDALWQLNTPRAELLDIAATLGSDVPFSLVGGTEFGRGRGHQLTTVLARGDYHWVFAISDFGLSTPKVFAEFDRLSPDATQPELAADLLAALAAGDVLRLGKLLVNDLQPAALSLQPRLKQVLSAGLDAGALAAIVSGSGPTCAFLVKSASAGEDFIVEMQTSGLQLRLVRAVGPARGAYLVSLD